MARQQTLVSSLATAMIFVLFGAQVSPAEDYGNRNALAFRFPPTAAAQTPTRVTAAPRRRSPEYIKVDALSKSAATPTLSDVPPFTGETSKYSVRVSRDERDDSSLTYDVTFNVRQSAQDTIQWYKNAVRQYGWSSDGTDEDLNDVLTVSKADKFLQIAVESDKNPSGFQTKVRLIYKPGI